MRLAASLTPAEATDKVVYQSADPQTATVDDSGLVVGLKVGKTVITATAGGVSAVCEVEVTSRAERRTGRDFPQRGREDNGA